MHRLYFFIENTFLTLKSLIKILVQSKYLLPEKLHQPCENKRIVILGNGPSLNDTFKNRSNFLKNSDLLCVNAFSLSEYFTLWKPKYYLLADPQFWIESPIQGQNVHTDSVLDSIISKTNWDLFLFMPYEARKHKVFLNKVKQNPKVRLCFYNNTTVTGYKWFYRLCYRLQLGIPRPQNVLIPALILSVNIGIKEIYLTGADHSWHENIIINDQNTLCFIDKHFYPDKPEPRAVKDIFTGEKIHIHDIFESLTIAFKNYHIISDYAKYRGVNIYNASEKSYIDAFERFIPAN
jgi:hypothetical protein